MSLVVDKASGPRFAWRGSSAQGRNLRDLEFGLFFCTILLHEILPLGMPCVVAVGILMWSGQGILREGLVWTILALGNTAIRRLTFGLLFFFFRLVFFPTLPDSLDSASLLLDLQRTPLLLTTIGLPAHGWTGRT